MHSDGNFDKLSAACGAKLLVTDRFLSSHKPAALAEDGYAGVVVDPLGEGVYQEAAC
jgi:hypothetical protein